MTTELHCRLVDLLNQRKKDSDEWRQGLTANPLTGKPLKKRDLLDPFPKGATDRQLDRFSNRTGVTLPAGLREWLKITNGAAGFYGVPPVQRGCNIEELWGLRPYWKHRAWIPVAHDDFGNYYVQLAPMADDASIQPVGFVEAIGDDHIAYVVASDAVQFALFKLEKFSAPFSDPPPRGAELREYALSTWPFGKKYVLSRDPRLGRIRGLPMPWSSE